MAVLHHLREERSVAFKGDGQNQKLIRIKLNKNKDVMTGDIQVCSLYLCYLDVSHHSGGLHPAGHIHCVAPDVIVRFTSSNHSSQNSSLIQT